MHARKSANSFAASTCLKLQKRVEQIFLFSLVPELDELLF